jgi:hypothetical protein
MGQDAFLMNENKRKEKITAYNEPKEPISYDEFDYGIEVVKINE